MGDERLRKKTRGLIRIEVNYVEHNKRYASLEVLALDGDVVAHGPLLREGGEAELVRARYEEIVERMK